ncbi:MAG: Phosphoglycolate phosphatase [Candidatus Midichloriaceae bacterium]|nr:Phosphoglycolate phosphatase [Candidatus Midichloriaceae bacterium]
MTLVMPKAVIFDWDNTLVGSWGKLHAAISATMEKMGMIPWTLEEVKSKMHRSSREFFPEFFKDRWQEARGYYYDNYKNSNLIAVTPLDSAVDTLDMLKAHGVKMAIISNKTGIYLRKEVETLGWSGYFESVLGAYDLDEDKPSPKPVYHTLEHIGLEPGPHNWFVGDTIVDIECAVNSNCYPILFGYQVDEAPHPSDRDIPHYHAVDHQDLMELFKRSVAK